MTWLVLAAMLLPAGGQTEEETTGGIQVSPPGEYPIVRETFTMRALAIVNPLVQDINTNYSTRWWEEQTNVHIEWDALVGSDAGEKVNLVLAAGQDLPDIIINTNLTLEQQYLYGSQGILLPLNDLVAEHAPNISSIWTAVDPYVKQQLTAPDGNVYGMSIRPLAYHSTLSQKMWINIQWLENLGLQMPETTEDFYQVLKAFKTRDANGNGDPNDEIPYSGVHKHWRGSTGAFVMNAFIYDDGFGEVTANRLILEKGKIYPAYTQPEWREGLRYLRRLHDEGLLDPQAFVMEAADARALNNGGKEGPARIGAAQGGQLWNILVPSGTMHREYRAVPPLKGPGGVQYTAYYPKNQRGSRFGITKDATSPAVAIKWVDLGFTEQGRMTAQFGEEGVNWRRANPGEMSYSGEPALWKLITVPNVPQNWCWSHFLPNYFEGIYFDRQVPASDDPLNIERRLWDESKAKYEGHQPDEVVPPLFMDLEVGKEYGRLRSEINTYVDQSFARFVTGDLDIEKDWDTYLAQFKPLGLERYLQIVQQTYDRQYK
jgi:putative aldouronate transport system substrate-binding protein